MAIGNDAKLVQRAREYLELTQGQFAKVLGVTRATVNRYENGHKLPDHVRNHIALLIREARSK